MCDLILDYMLGWLEIYVKKKIVMLKIVYELIVFMWLILLIKFKILKINIKIFKRFGKF